MFALIAGQGALPGVVAAVQDASPLVCAMRGYAPDTLTPDVTFRIEQLGSFLQDLSARGVTSVCLCGRVGRPDIDLAALDQATLPLVPVLRDALQQGDDGALRAVIGLIEAQGIAVIGAHEAAPQLLPPSGVLTTLAPDSDTRRDVALGDAALADMGQKDLGQACVIRGGAVILREDEAGTDAMLAKSATDPKTQETSDPFTWAMDAVGDLLGDAADWLSGPGAVTPDARAGFLFKGPKPDQDRRVDLPTIGPDTVVGAARAGLAGIVVEAGGVIVLERTKVIEMLDTAGMFLWVRERPAG